MVQKKIKLGESEYDVKHLSPKGMETLKSLEFVNARLLELENMQALLQRAKNSYGESLKKEMLTHKSGFQFDDN